MQRIIFVVALIFLDAKLSYATETLDLFILHLQKGAPVSTNCFATCNEVILSQKNVLEAHAQEFSDARFLSLLSSRLGSLGDLDLQSKLRRGQALALARHVPYHVIPHSISSRANHLGIQLARIHMHLPDLVETNDKDHLIFKPLRHCFFIVNDAQDATICHSWENAFSFRCNKPTSLPEFDTQILDLKERVDAYLNRRDSLTHNDVANWFLQETSVSNEPVVLSKAEYEDLVDSEAVKFFHTLNFNAFTAFFSQLARKEPSEVGRQISLANFAGRAVFVALTLGASEWHLVSDRDLLPWQTH